MLQMQLFFILLKNLVPEKAKLSNAANHDELNELEDMQSYCHNTKLCRRLLLLKHFDRTDEAYKECFTPGQQGHKFRHQIEGKNVYI